MLPVAPNIDFSILGPLAGLQAVEAAIFNQVPCGLQLFSVSYTFTDADAANGYAFVPCALPATYDTTSYYIQCTLQSNGANGGFITLGYIGGDGAGHGAAPTTDGFTAVVLAVQNGGIAAGDGIILYCLTNSFVPIVTP